MKRFSLILLLTSLVFSNAPTLAQDRAAQTPVRADDGLSKVREVVQGAVAQGHISGAVAYVARDGRTLHFAAVGERDTGRPMTKDTLFRIASMTKPITSVGVMMLVEEGKLQLDDPLAHYLPEFEQMRVREAQTGELVAPNRAISIRDLLTHTAGIPYEFNASQPMRELLQAAGVADGLSPRDPLLADNVRRLAAVPLAHQPGAAWTYGLNTDVLGRVIEVASGQPLDRYFAERIFQPLRMVDTGFHVPAEKHDRLAAIFKPAANSTTRVVKIEADPETASTFTFSAKRVLTKPTYLSGGGGLVSSTSDYARFLQMMLDDGQLDGIRLLKPETVRAMTTNQIGQLDCPFSIHGDKFGLGFAVTTKRSGGQPADNAGVASRASIGSYSWGGIYHTFFWVDPRERIVAIVMTQLYPWGDSTLWSDFQQAVYAELVTVQARGN